MIHRPIAIALAVLLIAPFLPSQHRATAAALTCKPMGTAIIEVDNEFMTFDTKGVVLDQSGWPCVQIALENNHTYWFKSDIHSSYPELLWTADNTWAQFGYIPPDERAIYTVIFDAKFDSWIIYFLNAGMTLDGSTSAAHFTVLQRTIDAMLLTLGATKRFVDADLATLIEITELMAGMSDCIGGITDIIEGGILATFGAADDLIRCLSDEEQIAVFSAILAKFGVSVTQRQLQELLPLIDLPKLIENIVDTAIAIATQTAAGSVQFTSEPIHEPDRDTNTA